MTTDEPKISLAQQIEEVHYELGQRKNVYERIANQHPRRRSELNYHVARMEAVLATLEWLRENEEKIKAAAL